MEARRTVLSVVVSVVVSVVSKSKAPCCGPLFKTAAAAVKDSPTSLPSTLITFPSSSNRIADPLPLPLSFGLAAGCSAGCSAGVKSKVPCAGSLVAR